MAIQSKDSRKFSAEELKEQYLENLGKLWEAASTGTDNSVSVLYAKMKNDKAVSLAEVALAQKNGAQLTDDEKVQIHAAANNWVKTTGLEQLKTSLIQSEQEEDGIAKAGRLMKIWKGFDGGIIAGIMSIVDNFKEYVTAALESRKTGEDVATVRARNQILASVEGFAKDNKLSGQFLKEVKKPSEEAVMLTQKAPPPPPLTPEQEAESKRVEEQKVAEARQNEENRLIEKAENEARFNVRKDLAAKRAADEERARLEKSGHSVVGGTSEGHGSKLSGSQHASNRIAVGATGKS